MPSTIAPISSKALKLPANQRMSLATLLLESLAETPEVDAKLLGELNKRAKELRSGKIKGMSTREAYGFTI